MGIIKAKAQGRADMGAVGAKIKAKLGGLNRGRRSMAGRIPQSLHRRARRARRHRRDHRRARAAEKSRPRIQGLLPVPQRENRLLLGQPRQAVLSLLRLRRARHGARLSDAVREAGVPRRGGGSGQRAGLEVPREAQRRGARPRDDLAPLYELLRRVAAFFERICRPARARSDYAEQRGLDAETIGASRSATRRTPGTRCSSASAAATSSSASCCTTGLIIEREQRQRTASTTASATG